MISPLIAVCLWVLVAFVMAVIPSDDNHWRRAYVLIAVGVPLLIWVVWAEGLLWGLVVLGVGASVLRWPVKFFWRWLLRVAGRR